MTKLLLWSGWLLAAVGFGLVWYLEIYHEVPPPHHWSITCINKEGRVIYEDRTVNWAPYAYKRQGVTCIVKGEEK